MTSDSPRDSGRAPATGRSRRVAMWLAAAYGVAVVLVGFWGSPVDAAAGPTLDRVIAIAHRHGAPDWFGYGTIESLSNVVFFVPLGLLVVLLAGARWWWAGAAAGLAASACIETAQALFLPARTSSIDDVLANGLGAVLGAAVGVLALAWAEHHRRR
ncbi:VanZ family protein [Curtobacterium sp. PhB25]|uniref:VanZ family protein n=1 Tax=Curtobacterium sp. PhB25 TaxID=2485205 RepID=UPI0010648DCB|nr:VanZ family protein [Curtobacterium sp. PhB25]